MMMLEDARFIAVSLGYWGMGETIPEALEKLKKLHGDTRNCVIFLCHKDAYIDSQGFLVSPSEHKAREVYKFGLKKGKGR